MKPPAAPAGGALAASPALSTYGPIKSSEALETLRQEPPEATFNELLRKTKRIPCVSHAGTYLIQSGNPLVPCVAPLFSYNTNAKDGLFFTPTPKILFRVGILTGAVIVAWVTAFFHAVYVLQIWTRTPFMLHSGVNSLRWVEYAITASIMAAFVNLNVGITDFYVFVKTFAIYIAVQIIGYTLEIMDCNDPVHARVASMLWTQATVLNLTNIAILLYQLFASSLHTAVLYYNIIPYALYYQTFGVVAWLSFKRTGPFASASYAEAWYIALSLSTKFATFCMSFSTFRGLEEDRGFAPKTPGINWNSVRYTASYLPAAILIAVALQQTYSWRKPTLKSKQGDTSKPVLESLTESTCTYPSKSGGSAPRLRL